MALSNGNCQRAQTPNSWTVAQYTVSYNTQRRALQQQQQPQPHQQHQKQKQQQYHIQQQSHLIENKKYSSIENSSNWKDSNCIRTTRKCAILTRGASADRNNGKRENLQPKLTRTSFQLRSHSSINGQTLNYNFTRHSQRDQSQQHKPHRNYINLLNNDNISKTNNNNNTTNSNSSSNNNAKHRQSNAVYTALKQKNHRTVIAWSSTSSLLKTFNEELLQGICRRDCKNNCNHIQNNNNNNCNINETHVKTKVQQPTTAAIQNTTSLGGETNRVNLNIVLEQTIRATNDIEPAGHSDVDSCSETQTALGQGEIKTRAPHAIPITATTLTSTSQRCAEFQSYRRNTTFNASTNSDTYSPKIVTPPTAATIISGVHLSNAELIPTATSFTTNITGNSAVRRQPFVRAMSAPVRYENNSHHNSSKSSVLGANKRKTRNRSRKTITRNISCDTAAQQQTSTSNIHKTVSAADGNKCDPTLLIDESNKKLVARTARSTTVTDIITLVSLINTELSDSEKEDDTCTSLVSHSDSAKTANARAPLLHKTGKSVSFQENFMYPPNYQLAAKEYSHMIRRSSIAPLVARFRSNVRSAPPASIFLSDKEKKTSVIVTTTASATSVMADENMSVGTNTTMCLNMADEQKNDICQDNGPINTPSVKNDIKCGDNENTCDASATDLVYPQYVQSLKERECWKLYLKMSNKGVNVSYETVLRGMLTPTEFRQVQKQRELEDAKVRALTELDHECVDGKKSNVPHIQHTTTAMERLSETLLQK